MVSSLLSQLGFHLAYLLGDGGFILPVLALVRDVGVDGYPVHLCLPFGGSSRHYCLHHWQARSRRSRRFPGRKFMNYEGGLTKDELVVALGGPVIEIASPSQ